MFEFKLPDLGEGVHEGEILKWHVAEGGLVAEDAPLVDVETDKAAVTIPSPAGGTLTKQGGKVGDVVMVGSVIAVIDAAGAPAAAAKPAAPAKAAEAKPATAPAQAAPAPATPARPAPRLRPRSPRLRRVQPARRPRRPLPLARPRGRVRWPQRPPCVEWRARWASICIR